MTCRNLNFVLFKDIRNISLPMLSVIKREGEREREKERNANIFAL